MAQHARRLFILGLAMSPPGTMGGNTKIALELARHCARDYQVHIILPSDKAETVTGNVALGENLVLCLVEPYPTTSVLFHLHEAWSVTRKLRRLFATLDVQPDEPVYACSDYLSETLAAFLLKPRFGFRWIPSCFLFVPSPWENATRRYGFPWLLYSLAYLYGRVTFGLIRARADQCVITNDSDRKHFPAAWRDRLPAIYGGVNVEQLAAVEQEPVTTRFEVVFCGRLCVQKGISRFLDIWKAVVRRMPQAKLAVIGNGRLRYERALRRKADRLGLSSTIDWLGYVNGEAKYRIYRASRLFVHPTVYDNNGMVAAEALCTGLPVVMSDLASLREVYTTGCAETDFSKVEATAERIAGLLADPARLAALAPTRAQLQALRKTWCWETRAREFTEFLERGAGR